MATSSSRTFITGATGDIGLKLVDLSQESHMPILVLCRRQDQIDNFRKRGVDAVRGTLDDSVDKLAKLMQGCDQLFLNTAATPAQLQHNLNAIDAAIAAGVKWIVKISAGDAREGTGVPWATAHAKADKYLIETTGKHSVSWTLLSPSAFMQNLLSQAPAIKKGFLPQTSGQGMAGWIDTVDIAAVSSRVLLDGPEKHHGQNYILTGPQLISAPQIADAISRQVGHAVRYLHLPGPVFGALLRLSGSDAWMANGLVAQFVDIVRPNKEGIEASDAVERLTSRQPISIDQFAARHKEDLAGFDVLPYIVVAAMVPVALIVGRRFR